MTTRQIAYRLKAEGKTELRRDQQEVAQGFKETYAAAEQGASVAESVTGAVAVLRRFSPSLNEQTIIEQVTANRQQYPLARLSHDQFDRFLADLNAFL